MKAKTGLGFVFAICIIMFVVSIVVVVINTIHLDNTVTAAKYRAQTCASAEEMHTRLIELDAVMEKEGMNAGYCSLLNHNVWTDMKEIRKNIQALIIRTDEVRQLDHKTDAYQSGLDDIRGNIRELETSVFGWWTYNGGGWIWFLLLGPLFTILGIIFGIAFFVNDDY
ncbi:MAG: hypothetical protein WC520_03860 [Candidatus Paceibacterota bacterium]